VTDSVIIQGRQIGPPELAHVLQLLHAHPDWSRRRISIQLATDWDWRNPAGQLKDMAARTLLLKLEQRHDKGSTHNLGRFFAEAIRSLF